MNRHYPQNPSQYSEGSRERNERWSPDDYRGAQPTWREDNPNRVPNRSGWGERNSYQQPSPYSQQHSPYSQQSSYSQQSPYSQQSSGQSGEYDYDQNWQGNREYDESVYGSDWEGRRNAPWHEEHENFSGQQDYHLGSSAPRRYPYRDRADNQRWGQNAGQQQSSGQQHHDWQPSWQQRSQAYGDSGRFGYRQPSSWYGSSQSAQGQNYEYGYGRGYEGRQNSPSTGAYGLQQTANHRGRAPKGYVRPDERIREEICECLSDDPHIDASEITVQVREGVVTLEGSVQDRGQKHRVEDIADNCSGVKDVHNGLRVSRAANQASTFGTSGSSSTSAAGTSSLSGASSSNDTSKNQDSSAGKKSSLS